MAGGENQPEVVDAEEVAEDDEEEGMVIQEFDDEQDAFHDALFNYPRALGYAAGVYEKLEPDAQADLVLVAVGRTGAMQFVGKGEHFATNEESAITHDCILVYASDIRALVGGETEPEG